MTRAATRCCSRPASPTSRTASSVAFARAGRIDAGKIEPAVGSAVAAAASSIDAAWQPRFICRGAVRCSGAGGRPRRSSRSPYAGAEIEREGSVDPVGSFGGGGRERRSIRLEEGTELLGLVAADQLARFQEQGPFLLGEVALDVLAQDAEPDHPLLVVRDVRAELDQQPFDDVVVLDRLECAAAGLLVGLEHRVEVALLQICMPKQSLAELLEDQLPAKSSLQPFDVIEQLADLRVITLQHFEQVH